MAARIALPGYAVPLNRTTSSGAQRRTAASRLMAASMKPGRPRRGDCGRRHAPRATRSSGPRRWQTSRTVAWSTWKCGHIGAWSPTRRTPTRGVRAGDVVLQLKSPYHDGTTHIVMAPLEFKQRLAASVPRPRLHLIRFHGVLAPNAKLRPEIVPSAPVNATNSAAGHRNTAHPSGPARIGLSPAAQTGVRYRYGTLSPVRRHLENHRRHRTSSRDRQDPHTSRLARPGTAPITGAARRSPPNGLIPDRTPIRSGSAP